MLSSIVASADPIEINGLYYILDSTTNQAELTKSNGSSYRGDIIIPETVTYNNINYNVTSIGASAFYYCKSLTSVIIPNSVKAIGTSAFSDCSLTSITIPNSVTKIGGRAFQNCTGLTSITIPNSVTTVYGYTFSGCSNLSSVNLSNNIKTLWFEMFRDCTSLETIIIPEGVTFIDENVFYGCTNLTSITFPNSLERLKDYSLQNTKWFKNKPDGLVYAGNVVFKYKWNGYSTPSNTNIILEEGLKGIAANAFNDCRWLTSISFPESLVAIEIQAFQGCTSLDQIDVPENVIHIGSKAFENTKWYNNKPDGLVYAGNVVYCYKGTIPQSIILDEGVKAIACAAFVGGEELVSIEIPDGVTYIGDVAFNRCGKLSSIVLPQSISSIGENTFVNCSSLTNVYCYAIDVPTAVNYSFDNSYIRNATLYVPLASIDAYQAVEPWCNFGMIKAIMACSTPEISFNNGKVLFSCETEDVEFVPTVTCSPVQTLNGNELKLGTEFIVSVYARREGYENSDVVTKTISLSSVGDIDGDGEVSVTDVTLLVNMILGK